MQELQFWAQTLAVLDQKPVAKHELKQAMSFGFFHLQQSCEGPHPLLSIQQRIAPAQIRFDTQCTIRGAMSTHLLHAFSP